MTNDELIGKVATKYLADRLSTEESAGVARFLLDCLTAEQTASVAKAVMQDARLKDNVDIKLPQHFVEHLGLPSNVLTKERTTYFRNAATDKNALLVANTGDDEEQSLKELEPIGAPQLLDFPQLWVDVVTDGLPILATHKSWWVKSIQALLEVRSFALDRLAQYLLDTRSALEDGHTILAALGVAFPALRVPRDTGFFTGLSDRNVTHLSKWKALFTQAIKKRACYLVKQTPNQSLLLQEDLWASFEKVEDVIPEEFHTRIVAFINCNSGWNKEADDLARCEWELIKPLFDGLKREKFNLGKATLEFFDERELDLLTREERDYLERLRDGSRTGAQDEDEQFYRDHRHQLKEDPALKGKWDRFIFGTPVEAPDFLVGLASCCEWLFDQDMPSSKRKLHISCDRRTKKDLKELNVDAGLFFASRYRGVKVLFGSRVSWDIGELLNFETLDQQWRSARKPYVNRSNSKSALQLKFLLELDVELSNGATETYPKQLIWRFDPNAITGEFAGDWQRLPEHPLVKCEVSREPVNVKGRYQSLDLRDVHTLYPAYGQDRGSFVSVYKKENDIALVWRANLAEASGRGLISESTASTLQTLFDGFVADYTAAITGFREDGLSSKILVKQCKSYGALLRAICVQAKGDRNRQLLLRPLLEIGTVAVDGGRPTAIVAPWHPLRLAAISEKANQVSGLMKYLLSADEVFFGDPPLYFKELKQELLHPYYPEIVVGWQKHKPELLSITDYYLDYSLHELPVAGDEGFDDTNENPSDTSELVLDLTKRFLALYPHEGANFSVVLYNCDSARLPYALVEKMNSLQNGDGDMRCQIILRHRDGVKLRELYEKLIESSDADADSFVSSEAARDFMARLRIGIMADQAPVRDMKDGPPADIVFLQDVIARHATVEWYSETSHPVESDTFVPSRWSRRRPSPFDDMKSVVYLCCPVQTAEGWEFITALTTFFKGDWDAVEDTRLLPARKLDFGDPITSSVFQEVHNLGNWVVNYDELLDRRQLLNQSVKVIRYKQCATQGRNLLISSTAPLSLLRSMVSGLIKSLNLELDSVACQRLTEKFINDANEISGDIVLRAAKRGRNARELMGVVLSRYLIRHELGVNQRFGWYFLDDYAEWLGQREEQIADILALAPTRSADGKLQLAVCIAESKFIESSSLASKRKESQRQLRDTILRVHDALFGDPKRIDRDLWLSRFSDLMLNGIQFPANENIDLSTWRRAVREGKCEISLRGYSHIFVSNDPDASDFSECVAVAGTPNSYQEVFSRSKLRDLVLRYWQDIDPSSVRGVERGSGPGFTRPSERVNMTGNENTDVSELRTNNQSKIAGTPSEKPDAPPRPVDSEKATADQPEFRKGAKCWTYPRFGALLSEWQRESEDSAAENEWLKQTENRCKGALQQFQLQSKLLSSSLTPNAALLKFQGSANLTVEQVLRRRSEFLTTHKLNLISVRAEPGIVSIAVARENRRVLFLPQVWRDWCPDCEVGNQDLMIAIKEDDNRPLFLSPKANAPHSLIAGSTGSGKSVLMRNIILGIACTNTPDQAKITLIDPKLGVDYFAFEGLPHLQGGIIDSPENAVSRLNELVDEMNRRYGVLRANRVSNIFDLNKKANVTERLPFLWVIHDEFAEWMLTPDYAEAVSEIVARLGVKARAAGISLVFAAQRPDANVMPMQLRANLGNRLVLRVDGEGTSEIALGEKGAERLLGKGHLAAKLEGEPEIIYAQVPFVEDDFLVSAVDLMKTSPSENLN